MNCWSCTTPLAQSPSSGASGYATIPGLEGKEHKICYQCAADREESQMIQTGRASLYLKRLAPVGMISRRYQVTNWTGVLTFTPGYVNAEAWPGKLPRCHVRFIGPDGKVWSGRNAGDSDLVHCKRTKLKSVFA